MFGMMTVALALAAQADAAPPPADAGPSEIIVEGERSVDRDRQIKEFVGALTEAPFTGQLSRFDWAVCPAAVGLDPARNAAIVARMRKVAEAAGIKRADPGCRPNALVIVTSDKAELIEKLGKAYPAYFSGIDAGERRRLARQPGPAAAWQVEGLLDRYGRAVPQDMLGGYSVIEDTDMPSRIKPATRPHFAASVVVVEIGALAGLSVTQLADYAAMRTFARTDPSRLEGSGAPTILTVLEAPMNSAVPLTLTEWDLGFLKALYASEPNRYASQQRNDIRKRLGRDLKRGE